MSSKSRLGLQKTTRRRHGLLRCGVRQRTERHRSSWQHGCNRSRLRSSLSPPSPCGIARRWRGHHHHRCRETSRRRGCGVRAGGLHWWRRYVACGAISCTGTVPDWSPVFIWRSVVVAVADAGCADRLVLLANGALEGLLGGVDVGCEPVRRARPLAGTHGRRNCWGRTTSVLPRAAPPPQGPPNGVSE